ncbi:MAG: AAA family ATPase [Pseudomonadota bacterium]
MVDRRIRDRLDNPFDVIQPGEHWSTTSFTAYELQRIDFPPVRFAVDTVLAQGATLLAGKPKTYKSWLALECAVAVATGGRACGAWDAPMGDVLAFFAEDNPRRLKSRLRYYFDQEDWPDNLAIRTEVPRLGAGLREALHDWVSVNEHPALVIIDTFNFVRPLRDKTSGYQTDYADSGVLAQLANELDISLLAIHHQRKMDADDPLDSVSGTTGISGGFDSVLALTRSNSGGFELHGRGRDLPEINLAMDFDADVCRWKLLGDVDDVKKSETRQAILSALRDGDMGPSEIAEATGLGASNVKMTLARMLKDGEIAKQGRGVWGLVTSVTCDLQSHKDTQVTGI